MCDTNCKSFTKHGTQCNNKALEGISSCPKHANRFDATSSVQPMKKSDAIILDHLYELVKFGHPYFQIFDECVRTYIATIIFKTNSKSKAIDIIMYDQQSFAVMFNAWIVLKGQRKLFFI